MAANLKAIGLHAACPSRPPVPKAPAPRGEGRPAGDPAGLSYYSATRRLKDPKHSERLRRLGAKAAKLELPKKIIRELLEAATPRGATPAHIEGAERLMSSPVFTGLSAHERLFVLRRYKGMHVSATLREAFLLLLERKALLGLSLDQRAELFRYAVGPKPGRYAHPSHHTALLDRWALRTRELCRFVDAPDIDVARGWQAFIHDVVRPLHILRTLADLDLTIFVFGAVNNPRSISYCRTIDFDSSGHVEAAVLSPDPRVDSSWRGDDPVTRYAFERRSTQLSRLEELELIRWVEQNHAVSSHFEYRPTQMPFSVFLNARRMHEEFEPALRAITAVRGFLNFDRAILHRGQPQRAYEKSLRLTLRDLSL